jgi:hypothetical protein
MNIQRFVNNSHVKGDSYMATELTGGVTQKTTTNNLDPYAVGLLFEAMRAWKLRKLLAEEEATKTDTPVLTSHNSQIDK